MDRLLVVGMLAAIGGVGLLVEALRPVAMILAAALLLMRGPYGRQDHDGR
jgi:hypothetical protein